MYRILIIVLLITSCGNDEVVTPKPSAPRIAISDQSFTEGEEGLILISLTGKFEAPISVNYKPIAKTATAGEDFDQSEGLVYFPLDGTGNTQSIFVEIFDDVITEEAETFEIVFTSDNDVDISNEKITITILDNDEAHTDNNFEGYVTPREYEGWNLFWSDEFGGSELNLENWIQANKGNWYNNELQFYKPENTEVGDGLLTITAKEEWHEGHYYTSSRMWSQHKIFFNFGRVDIRAKLPFSQGLWPALWMMGENRDTVGWPQCGEIDIMELRGHTPNTVSSTIHYKNHDGLHKYPSSKKYELSTGNFSDEFHVFSLVWTEDQFEIFVDDILYNTIIHPDIFYFNGDNPFLKDFYLLMNVAVGGDFGGNPDDTTIWPQKMEVDYVRVFQKD